MLSITLPHDDSPILIKKNGVFFIKMLDNYSPMLNGFFYV